MAKVKYNRLMSWLKKEIEGDLVEEAQKDCKGCQVLRDIQKALDSVQRPKES